MGEEQVKKNARLENNMHQEFQEIIAAAMGARSGAEVVQMRVLMADFVCVAGRLFASLCNRSKTLTAAQNLARCHPLLDPPSEG